jgi:hypothetical protein
MAGPVTHAGAGYTEACGRVQSHNREDWSNGEGSGEEGSVGTIRIL